MEVNKKKKQFEITRFEKICSNFKVIRLITQKEKNGYFFVGGYVIIEYKKASMIKFSV